jgi:hypothetical protein
VALWLAGFGWCINGTPTSPELPTNPEPATTLWESYDEPSMRQWVDESSRDHHYSASINTFLRKMLAGLDQPHGRSAWEVVRCRPAAIFWPSLLPTASATLRSRRGAVGCAWSSRPTSPPPPPPAVGLPVARLCAYSPMWTGALNKPAPLELRCAAGETIERLVWARWQAFTSGADAPEGVNGWCGGRCIIFGGALTEMYLCNVCSCQEILRRHGRAQALLRGPGPAQECVRHRRHGKARAAVRGEAVLQPHWCGAHAWAPMQGRCGERAVSILESFHID